MSESFQPFSLSDAAAWITPPEPDTDKYGRGVLGVATGSSAYPGAAVIGVDAAVHTGVGMVRYVGPQRATDFVLHARPEVVWGVGRVQAWLVGSGTSADTLNDLEPETRGGFEHATTDDVPVVVDAGAIGLVELGAHAVITPHAGELAKLLEVERQAVADDPQGSALRAAERTGATVLLKGRNTHVVSPDGGLRLVASSATPWLAAAGAGDALGGVLGALVATRAARGPLGDGDLAHLAAAAAVVHGHAAVLASNGGPFPMQDLARAIPGVIADLAAR